VKRDQQAFFGRRNDWQEIGIAPFEMSEQEGTILIQHVSTGAEIAGGTSSLVRIPHAGYSWPVKALAAHVRRLAVLRQQAQAGRVALRNIQDRFSERLKDGAGRIG
jgi:hypothetical protein